jgi:hypothetical protein
LKGGWFPEAPNHGSAARVACFTQVICDRVESRALHKTQVLRLRNGSACRSHASTSSPHETLLSDLVRLEEIEVAEADFPRFDLYRACGHCCLIQRKAAAGAQDNPVESVVLAGGSPTGPEVACSQVGTSSRATCAGAASLVHDSGALIEFLTHGVSLPGRRIERTPAPIATAELVCGACYVSVNQRESPLWRPMRKYRAARAQE